ncbi:hypothetical protein E2C01_013750 [Portunus trituberculatus]|uniref:Uncharacterized protein n=1 Tax=Portunus trituberculatus TaxID=210409 RepID=A0A5B7DH28_PORTR|nr:hypothetical protein [Portunus trituberculatus]
MDTVYLRRLPNQLSGEEALRRERKRVGEKTCGLDSTWNACLLFLTWLYVMIIPNSVNYR